MEQSPPSLIIREGQTDINSDHSVTTLDTFLWYRQDQGKSLESLFLLMSNRAVRKKGGLTASFDTKARGTPCISQPPFLASLPNTSVPWTHSVPLMLPVCTQTCSSGSSPHPCCRDCGSEDSFTVSGSLPERKFLS